MEEFQFRENIKLLFSHLYQKDKDFFHHVEEKTLFEERNPPPPHR